MHGQRSSGVSLQIAVFCHSLASDWNHGNAHFLRGIVSELQANGHKVRVFEPRNGWSRQNLLRDHGEQALRDFERAFPHLSSTVYDPGDLQIAEWLDSADLALVHEWNDPELIARIGEHRKTNSGLRIFFHDTHHRAITAPAQLKRFDLTHFDGVLVYGESLRQAYQKLGWGKEVHVWHEAADVRVFHPIPEIGRSGDLVWIGNWGDDERTEELREYFIRPCADLSVQAKAFGVRYPQTALDELAAAGISYGGWLPNHAAPKVFAQHKVTIHVPRRPYTRQLPGIPTIRPFEALACGIPLISSPWQDIEHLFRPGIDFLMARDGSEMRNFLSDIVHDRSVAETLAARGLETIIGRHTCAHRVSELLTIYNDVKPISAILPMELPRSEMHS
jgi:spore maturation protein CgeB